MDELIERLAARTVVDSAIAGKIIGMILDFLRKEDPAAGTPDVCQFV